MSRPAFEVVDVVSRFGKPGHVIKYLGQYTHRVAISNHRIIAINNESVSFMHKDHGDHARQKPITLSGVEFLRRIRSPDTILVFGI